MELKLNIKDRIFLPQLCSAQNTYLDYALKKSIIKKVALTDADKEKYEIKEDRENQRLTWNIQTDMAQPLVVDFSQSELEYLKKAAEEHADKPAPDELWLTVDKIYDAINAK